MAAKKAKSGVEVVQEVINNMANSVPDRKEGRPVPVESSMTAKCGHEDALGYFSGTVCGNCARKAHKKAMGK